VPFGATLAHAGPEIGRCAPGPAYPLAAAQSWVPANRSCPTVADDYPLGFRVALHPKDLGIALAVARDAGAALPVAALAARLEAGLVAGGHAADDMSALARAIRSLSGLEGWAPPPARAGRLRPRSPGATIRACTTSSS